MSRLFFNLIFVLALSLCLAAQDAKPANANPASAPAPAVAAPSAAPAANPQSATPASGTPAPAPAPGTPAATAKPEAQKPATPPPPPLPPTTPVITLDFCKGAKAAASAAAKTACKKVITKAEFDKILDAAIPRSRRPGGGDVPPQVKEAVAKEYVNMYIMSREAEKRDLMAKDPKISEMLQLTRMQVLAMAMNQDLQENTKISDAEIEKYYNENPSAFLEVSLRRLYIPKPSPVPAPNIANAFPPSGANPAANAATSANNAAAANIPKPEDTAALKAAAEKIHDRAVAGEDFDKLEKEAFDAAGQKQTPPPTQMGNRRRGILPPDQETEVFSLNAGGVSKMFENPGGWTFYKVDSKRTLPLSEVKEEIERKRQPEKFNDARQAITASVKSDLNESYFGGTPNPASGAVNASNGSAPTPANATAFTSPAGSGPRKSADKNGSSTTHKAAPSQTPAANTAH